MSVKKIFSMTTVVISQPMYLPWPGFIDHLSKADVIIWLDDVQFARRSFVHRVKVPQDGILRWLTIPLIKQAVGTPISEIKAADKNWQAAHMQILEQIYANSENFYEIKECFDVIEAGDRLHLTIIKMAEALYEMCTGKSLNSYISSEFKIVEKATDRILKLVQKFEGNRYITGHGAKNYFDHHLLEHSGIDVEYIDYDIKPWKQDTKEFTPFVSSFDLIANVPEQERKLHFNSSIINWKDFLKDNSV